MTKKNTDDVFDEELEDDVEVDEDGVEVEQEDLDADEAEQEEAEIDPVREAFDENQGDSEDDIKMAMIQAGATFKTVTRLYNEFLVDSGMLTSRSDKQATLNEVLSVEGLDLTNKEVFNNTIDELVGYLTGVDRTSVAASVRGWCKKNDVEHYKAPKGGGGGASGFSSMFYAALISNPEMSESDANQIIDGKVEGIHASENVQRHRSHYQAIRKMANDISAQYLG